MKNFTCRILVSLLLVVPLLFAPVFQAGAAARFTGGLSIDVNPSIALTVENGTVSAASAYNDDGKQLLSGGEVVGLTAEEAVRVMTQLLVANGYLTAGDHTPYLLITTFGGGAEDLAALRQSAEQTALELNAEFEIRTGQVSDEVAAAAEAAGLTPAKYLLMRYIAAQEGIALEEAVARYGMASVGELAEQFGDFDALLEYAALLTEEQMTALNTAFEQMKAGITAAEKTYQDAVKALKERYRVTAQDAAKAIDDEAELAAVIDRLKTEILADYEGIQKALDGDTAAARDEFQKAVDAARIPREITDAYISWHLNKELNAVNELTNFVESFKNLSQNGNGDQGQGKSGENSGQGNINENAEQNQEKNQNQDERQNQEQEQQKEQNEEGTQTQDQQQDKQQGQQNDQQQDKAQSSIGSGKGKGGN